MYQYTCDVKDPQRYSQLCLNDQQINEMTKSLLGETLQSCSKVGMNPFRALNPIPDAKSPFWKKKLPAAALPKKPKTTIGGPGRPKKSTAEDLLKVDDESEVELDSLGHLFMQLIAADSSQGDVETSHANAIEVIPVSFDSEPLARQKTRWVIRKVKFSHPLAYLDPNFLLKKQQHEARRQTRSGGSQDLISGFPNTPAPRKRNHEKTPPSSGDSSGTQMHVFKVAPGGMAKVDKKHKLGGS
ncbi:uncharacterized protein [Triticum aestivum]|uniref:uncharacterized protein n=1 Tax=Triticum aestivum TaxID=4565 RepID=UPI001D01C695|nr:uncharacterized protein LOC123078457 [Triticum aestivum]